MTSAIQFDIARAQDIGTLLTCATLIENDDTLDRSEKQELKLLLADRMNVIAPKPSSSDSTRYPVGRWNDLTEVQKH